MQRNPYGKVPVLVDGDGVIYESAIINEYLEEKFPEIRLLPSDLLRRSTVRIWIDFFNTRVHPAASDLAHNREPEKAREQLDRHLHRLDQELAGFVVGHRAGVRNRQHGAVERMSRHCVYRLLPARCACCRRERRVPRFAARRSVLYSTRRNFYIKFKDFLTPGQNAH